MSKYDLIYYWQNYLINQENVEFKANSYVLKFSLINSYSRDYFCNWYSFKDSNELIGFFKYILIPSIYITKVFGKSENTIFLDALGYYETIDIIEESEDDDKNEILQEIKEVYKILDNLKENFCIKKFKRFINKINERDIKKNGIFTRMEFFEDVKEIGRDLVKEFESDDMLDELEKQMDLNKNQIIDLFDGIEKNPFMLKRIGTYLSNTLAF